MSRELSSIVILYMVAQEAFVFWWFWHSLISPKVVPNTTKDKPNMQAVKPGNACDFMFKMLFDTKMVPHATTNANGFCFNDLHNSPM